MDIRIAGLCDGECECNTHCGCYINGGECKRTTQVEHMIHADRREIKLEGYIDKNDHTAVFSEIEE